ncbi:MAG: aldo/keto reductase [Gemmatimonadales bacterium]
MTPTPEQETGHMEHRVLGRTGFKVSVIGFGAWGIGGAMWSDADDERSLAALRAALESGCTFIDTALAYGEGRSERLVGRALAGWQGKVIVATKVPPLDRHWPAEAGVGLARVFPAAYVRRTAELCASNLGRPIDLLQLHVWRDEYLDEPGWPAVVDTVASLIKAGTIRSFGISVTEHVPDSGLEAVRRSDIITAVQVIYNVFDRQAEQRLFPLCQERNVGVIARVPLDEGGLTGTIGPDTTFPPGDWRNEYFAGDRKAELARRVDALKPLLLSEAPNLIDGALRFCLSHPAVTTVIPGMRTAEHARANCAIGDARPLSPALLKGLEAHAWPRDWYPHDPPVSRSALPSLVAALMLLFVWIVGTFVLPVGAGWIHLFLAAAVVLFIRWVVKGPIGK